MNPLAFCFLYSNFSVKSINILNLSLGQGMQNLTCCKDFFEFIPESPDVVMLDLDTPKQLAKVAQERSKVAG